MDIKALVLERDGEKKNFEDKIVVLDAVAAPIEDEAAELKALRTRAELVS